MNCFFVSCEIAENPDLRGKKVAVAPHTTDRKGIILASSYEARPFGVHSAMPVGEALRLCPDLILVEPSMSLYSEYSDMFFSYFMSITPLVEPASIDEGYLDITDVCKPDEVIDLANKIQQTLLNEYHLPCSIGIGPNKFLAKMASDMKKPLGITVLRKREIQEKMWPLAIEDMFGVGKKTLEKMKALNIKTIGDLATFKDLNLLEHVLGSMSFKSLYHNAYGEGDNEVDVNRYYDISSIGNSQTFEFDEYLPQNMLLTIKLLSNSVSNRLEKSGKKASTFTLQIKYNNFKVVSRSKTIGQHTANSYQMFEIFKDLFEEYYDDTYPVRLLGVSVSKLIDKKDEIQQLSLFDQLPQIEQEQKINNLIKTINQTIGKDSLHIGMDNIQVNRKYDSSFRSEIKKIQIKND